MLALILSPIGRKVAFVLAALLLLGGLYWFVYSRGHEAGRLDGNREQLELDRKAFEQDRAIFLGKLSKFQEANDAAQQVIQEKDAQLAQLQLRRNAAEKSVAALPVGAVVPDILKRLGQPPESVLTETDFRKIDAALAVVESLEENVKVLEEKSAQQDIRIHALEQQRDAALDYGNKVTALYVKAYSAAQKKPFWLWRIFGYKGKHLDLPAPATLHP